MYLLRHGFLMRYEVRISVELPGLSVGTAHTCLGRPGGFNFCFVSLRGRPGYICRVAHRTLCATRTPLGWSMAVFLCMWCSVFSVIPRFGRRVSICMLGLLTWLMQLERLRPLTLRP